ncbi:MAG TPA: glycine cleavage system aminomethyltransferase GcvT [Candidatus Limnocylindria bacterium]|nr:glycine cleavage system aminomethyltransferase GcvT [Candidatus Limnocylindria bacterium]
MGDELKRTSLYDEHRSLGARMVPFAGWEMPVQYASIVEEHQRVRTACGAFDLSHMGEFWFRGPGAGAWVNWLTTNDVARLDVGRAQYNLMCLPEGGIVDDVIVYRTGEDEYLMVVNAANVEKDRAHVTHDLPPSVRFEDASLSTALVAVQGPRASVVVMAVTNLPIREESIEALPPFGVRRARVADADAVIARTGYTGEDGFEIFVAWDSAPQVWTRVLAAGMSNGIGPIGLGARDTLRLEARLMLYGNDIDATTNPIEAALGWVVKGDKGPFQGRDAIALAKERGAARRLVGLVVDGGVARHGYEVTKGGAVVGNVTSGTFGPTLRKNIALAYVPTSLTAIGTPLCVRVRGRDISATVVKTPFYKRAG